MNDRLLSFLGICRRAGKLTIGADPSVESIKNHKAQLIIFASDFSKGSSKPVLLAAHTENVKTLTLNRSKAEVSYAVGRLCGVMAIEDKGFANKLAQLVMNEQGGELHDKI